MEQKLLIVDDEAHIRMLIEQTLEDLEDEGVELLFAENGEQALEIIKKEEPNLVFLDVMMPKMNGMEVCYKVKKELLLSHVYIILLTAKLSDLFDKYVFDLIVNGVSEFTVTLGSFIRRLHSGKVQQYIMFVVIAVFLMFVLFVNAGFISKYYTQILYILLGVFIAGVLIGLFAVYLTRKKKISRKR